MDYLKTLMFGGCQEWGKLGDGDEGGHCCDEHWVMHGSVESLYCTSETKITLLTGLK